MIFSEAIRHCYLCIIHLMSQEILSILIIMLESKLQSQRFILAHFKVNVLFVRFGFIANVIFAESNNAD